MKKTALILLLASLTSAPAHAAPVPAFQIDAIVDGTSAHAASGHFFVQTKVTNSGAQPETITTWSQYGWSWTSSVPGLRPAKDALQNVSQQVTLAPGESYGGEVEIFYDPPVSAPLTFKLSFVPNTTLPVAKSSDRNKDGIYWSNDITYRP